MAPLLCATDHLRGIDPRSNGAPPHSDFVICRRLAGQARPYWPHLSALLVLSLLSVPLAADAHQLKLVVDNVVGDAALPACSQRFSQRTFIPLLVC